MYISDSRSEWSSNFLQNPSFVIQNQNNDILNDNASSVTCSIDNILSYFF